MGKIDVSTRNAAMQRVYDDARKVRDIMGGTESMRLAGRLYLPQKEAESVDAYDKRLSVTTLYNKLADVVRTTSTKLLAKPIVAGDDFVDTNVLNHIDSEGRDATRFVLDWLMDALQVGVSYAMADYPSGGTGLTVEQERAAGLRPYATIIKQENLLSFAAERIGASEVLTRVNIAETVQEESANEFEEVFVDQVRVLRLRDSVMTYELWRQPEGKDWSVWQEETPTSLDFIPLVPLYTNRTGFMCGKPPFQDIADLNITHWQSSSSQRHILDFVRFPVLFGKGILMNAEGSVEYGANRLIMGDSSENSDLKHVEHSGAGIDAGSKDLAGLEAQMDELSKQMLTRRTGNVTATSRAIDEASATTDIQTLANVVDDTLNQLIDYLGAWTGVDYGTVSLNVDFSLGEATESDIKALQFAVSSGAMSNQEYMAELVRRGIKQEYDFEADQTEIETAPVIE